MRRYVNDTRDLIQHGPQEKLKTWRRQAVERIGVEPTGDLAVHPCLPEDGLSLLYQHGGPCRMEAITFPPVRIAAKAVVAGWQ